MSNVRAQGVSVLATQLFLLYQHAVSLSFRIPVVLPKNGHWVFQISSSYLFLTVSLFFDRLSSSLETSASGQLSDVNELLLHLERGQMPFSLDIIRKLSVVTLENTIANGLVFGAS